MVMGMGTWATRAIATALVAADGTGDFTDIQAAIDSLPAGGGVVYIKEGTYTITNNITFPQDNISLVGAGRSTIIQPIVGYTDTNLIEINTRNNCTIEKIYFYPNSAVIDAIYIVSSSNITVFACWGTNARYGINSASNTNNIYESCAFSLSVTGIYSYADQPIIIANNHCSTNNVGAGIGIELSSTVANQENVVLIGNTCNNNSSDGIYSHGIWYLGSVTQTAIIGNLCIGNGGCGINIYWTPCSLIGNRCYQNATGIKEYSLDFGLTNGNFCDNNTLNGFEIYTAWDCTFTGNVAYYNGQNGFYFDTVLSGRGCRRNSITGNQSTENKMHGMLFLGTDETTILFNTISGNTCYENDRLDTATYDGICLTGQRNTISNNTCIENDRNEITVSGTNNIVVGNIAYGTTHAAAIVADASTEMSHNVTS